jgi:hypothetical protein
MPARKVPSINPASEKKQATAETITAKRETTAATIMRACGAVPCEALRMVTALNRSTREREAKSQVVFFMRGRE